MQVYTVGGAVRDALLGLPVKDRDYVVVGSSPEAMRAAGYLPVGRDFPVFLHPATKAEYALARTERKSGRGYHGFVFHADASVTLEEDLARRDLTINAIAQAEDGALIDPYGGQADLAARVFRHVSSAFAEDPVRILRLARFAARFADFSVAPETLALCRQMVAEGEVDHLVSERVWQEIAKGLQEARPSRMFEVLRDTGALDRLLPELARLQGVAQRADYHPEGDVWIHTLMVVDIAASKQYSLPVRFAALLHDLGKGLTPDDILPRHIGHEQRGMQPIAAVCERLKAPVECRDLALLACKVHGQIHQFSRAGLRADTVIRILGEVDAWRRPERFARLLEVCTADHLGRGSVTEPEHPAVARWQTALAVGQSVDAGAVARAFLQSGGKPADVAVAVAKARTDALSGCALYSPNEENACN